MTEDKTDEPKSYFCPKLGHGEYKGRISCPHCFGCKCLHTYVLHRKEDKFTIKYVKICGDCGREKYV